MSKRTFGSLRLHEPSKRWVMDKVEPHVMIRLKSVFPKIPKTQVPPLIFAHSGETAVELEWFLQRYSFEVSEKDLSFIQAERDAHFAKLAALEVYARPDYKPRQFELKLPLREYQGQGLEIYLKNGVLLCGDAVGLGKTPLGIGSFTDKRLLPAIVVVQTHLPSQWVAQINKFIDLKVHIIKGTRPYDLPEADVYITTYSRLAGWVDIYSEKIFKQAIFDEIQELRLSGSDKYVAGKILAENVTHVLGLSATPIYNYGDEIWNILNLMKDGCLGPKTDFLREWGKEGGSREIANPKALGAYLREQFLFLRRTREDVGRELPKLNVLTQPVEYDQATVAKMEAIAEQLALKVMHGSFTERGKAARDLDMMVRHATGVSKAKYVAEFVKILLESGESVLLAGWHRDVYDIWNKELMAYNPVMYTGSETPKEKDKAKADFISGKSQIMFISLRSGIGLDGLQDRSSIVVFGELDWSPKVHEQVIGRLDRDRTDGKANQVTAIYMISDSGSDPMMVELLGLKASQASGITDPFAQVEVKESDGSRIKALAQQILKKRHKHKILVKELPPTAALEGEEEIEMMF